MTNRSQSVGWSIIHAPSFHHLYWLSSADTRQFSCLQAGVCQCFIWCYVDTADCKLTIYFSLKFWIHKTEAKQESWPKRIAAYAHMRIKLTCSLVLKQSLLVPKMHWSPLIPFHNKKICSSTSNSQALWTSGSTWRHHTWWLSNYNLTVDPSTLVLLSIQQ